MNGTISTPTERIVTITMTETEARTLRDLLGPGTSRSWDAYLTSSLNPNVSSAHDAWNLATDLYGAVNDALYA